MSSILVQLEKHELLEMRRIAAYIYKKAGRWKQSIALSKKDNMYKDCMETCSQSGDRELSEDMLVYFIEQVCLQNISVWITFFEMSVTVFLDNRNEFPPLVLITPVALNKNPNSSVR